MICKQHQILPAAQNVISILIMPINHWIGICNQARRHSLFYMFKKAKYQFITILITAKFWYFQNLEFDQVLSIPYTL